MTVPIAGDSQMASAAPQPEEPKKVSAAKRRGSPMTFLSDVALFFLTRLAGINTTLGEARSRRYASNGELPAYRVDSTQAEFLFNLQSEASAHTDDKVKQLMTLSSSLATISLVFARDVRPRWMIIAILGLLVCVVLLCVSVLAVRAGALPTLEDVDGSPNAEESWGRDLLIATTQNKAGHRFRVDRYRAALRFFCLALLLAPIAAMCTVAKTDQSAALVTQTARIERVLEQIRDAIGHLNTTDGRVPVAEPVLRAPRVTAHGQQPFAPSAEKRGPDTSGPRVGGRGKP